MSEVLVPALSLGMDDEGRRGEMIWNIKDCPTQQGQILQNPLLSSKRAIMENISRKENITQNK